MQCRPARREGMAMLARREEGVRPAGGQTNKSLLGPTSDRSVDLEGSVEESAANDPLLPGDITFRSMKREPE
jgi:hypothetical protein